ncbi:MAG: hypothetical protein Q7S24_00625 [bacterium]|nr:hypothetical protein [bacterium]
MESGIKEGLWHGAGVQDRAMTDSWGMNPMLFGGFMLLFITCPVFGCVINPKGDANLWGSSLGED